MSKCVAQSAQNFFETARRPKKLPTPGLAQYAEKLHKTPTSDKLDCFVISEIIVCVTNVLAYHTKIKFQHMVRTKVDEANVGRGSFTYEELRLQNTLKHFRFIFLPNSYFL